VKPEKGKVSDLLNSKFEAFSNRQKWYWIAGIALSVFVLDVITKIWAVYTLKGKPSIVIISHYFAFDYAENTGIAFGLFQDQGMLLHILTPIAFIVLLILVYRQFAMVRMDFWYILFFGLIIGGALGNILNRLYLGYVVDFILVHYYDKLWPNFNIADSALTIGEVILFCKLLFGSQPEAEPEQVENQNSSKKTTESMAVASSVSNSHQTE
jgi:signal peptidase II